MGYGSKPLGSFLGKRPANKRCFPLGSARELGFDPYPLVNPNWWKMITFLGGAPACENQQISTEVFLPRPVVQQTQLFWSWIFPTKKDYSQKDAKICVGSTARIACLITGTIDQVLLPYQRAGDYVCSVNSCLASTFKSQG